MNTRVLLQFSHPSPFSPPHPWPPSALCLNFYLPFCPLLHFFSPWHFKTCFGSMLYMFWACQGCYGACNMLPGMLWDPWHLLCGMLLVAPPVHEVEHFAYVHTWLLWIRDVSPICPISPQLGLNSTYTGTIVQKLKDFFVASKHYWCGIPRLNQGLNVLI